MQAIVREKLPNFIQGYNLGNAIHRRYGSGYGKSIMGADYSRRASRLTPETPHRDLHLPHAMERAPTWRLKHVFQFDR